MSIYIVILMYLEKNKMFYIFWTKKYYLMSAMNYSPLSTKLCSQVVVAVAFRGYQGNAGPTSQDRRRWKLSLPRPARIPRAPPSLSVCCAQIIATPPFLSLEVSLPERTAQSQNRKAESSAAMRGGGAGPTAAFMSDEPPPADAEEVEENSGAEEEDEETVVEQDDDELELGLCLGSKQQQQQHPPPCRILTARDLQPRSLSPDSSVSSSSPAAGAGTAAPSKRAKADAAPNSPGTVASGHPQRWAARTTPLALHVSSSSLPMQNNSSKHVFYSFNIILSGGKS